MYVVSCLVSSPTSIMVLFGLWVPVQKLGKLCKGTGCPPKKEEGRNTRHGQNQWPSQCRKSNFPPPYREFCCHETRKSPPAGLGLLSFWNLARPQHRGILTWWWITMLHRSWFLGNKNPTEIVVKSTEIVEKLNKMMVLSLVVAINENQWTSPLFIDVPCKRCESECNDHGLLSLASSLSESTY